MNGQYSTEQHAEFWREVRSMLSPEFFRGASATLSPELVGFFRKCSRMAELPLAAAPEAHPAADAARSAPTDPPRPDPSRPAPSRPDPILVIPGTFTRPLGNPRKRRWEILVDGKGQTATNRELELIILYAVHAKIPRGPDDWIIHTAPAIAGGGAPPKPP